MRKFSQRQLGIISESDDIFRIRVVVSDLNSEFRIFFRGHSEYSDNSEFFSEVNSEYSDNSDFFFPRSFGQFRFFFPEVIQSIRTIPNFFLRSIWIIRTIPNFFLEFRIICGKYMEIYQNPLFFHENIFFLIRKSLNTPNSIFRPNIRNLLLRVYTIITGSVNN